VSDRLAAAIARIDAANADDPVLVSTASGPRQKELVHAEAVTSWLLRLDPQADEAQQIAARAHHVRRWTVPRTSYPEGRAGYLRWRRDLKARLAEEVGAILADEGFSGDEIASVQGIVRKEGLGSDPRVQTHEDALCLVFMEQQLADVATRLGGEKAEAVLGKTLAKMSPDGRAEAAALDLGPEMGDMMAAAIGAADDAVSGTP
jgi:hypothetical protein